MSNWSEGPLPWDRKISMASGGSSSADNYDGDGKVVLSRFGEFSYSIGNDGELMADFADQGLICCYTEEGNLAFMALEMGSFLKKVQVESLDSLAKEGEDMRIVVESLRDAKLYLFLSVFPMINVVKLELRSGSELVNETILNDADFNLGYGGEITVNETVLPFHTKWQGDEMVLSIGEMSGKRRTLIPISVSSEVDFMRIIDTESSKRHRKLADQILLNR